VGSEQISGSQGQGSNLPRGQSKESGVRAHNSKKFLTISRYLDILISMQSLAFFKSLADETRIRLMNLLVQHELNVNEIVSIMAMGQSRISRHLKILTDSGLLTSRRDGLWVFYSASLNGQGAAYVDIFKAIIKDDELLQQDLRMLEDLLKQRFDEKSRYFDAVAGEWDSIKNQILDDRRFADEIVSLLEQCSIAADLGCGNGKLLPYLKRKAAGVIGVDKSSRMLEEARRSLLNNGNGIDLRIGEIEHLPMRDGEAEAAVINMVLHYLPSPVDGIREAGRILKKGGRLIIVDLDKHANEEMREKFGHRWLGFSLDELRDWLGTGGFSIAETSRHDVKKGLFMNIVLSIRE